MVAAAVVVLAAVAAAAAVEEAAEVAEMGLKVLNMMGEVAAASVLGLVGSF